jgi:hypothetical protein
MICVQRTKHIPEVLTERTKDGVLDLRLRLAERAGVKAVERHAP